MVRNRESTSTLPKPGVDRHADLTEPQALRERATADRHQHLRAIDAQLRAVFLLGLDSRPITPNQRAGHLGLEVKLETLLRQTLLEQIPHLLVGHRHDSRQKLDDGDRRSQPPPDRSQLEPDVTRAHDDQVVGNLVEAEGARRIDHDLAVEGKKRKVHRH